MRCIVDAQLPYRLAVFLRDQGWDVIHTDDLPNMERTSDNEIRALSSEEDRLVISKDNDFLHTYLVKGIPPKLLMITTGNIRNPELISLFEKHLYAIIELFSRCTLVELNNEELVGYE